MKHKTAQITLFIIIGIVVLVAVALLFYIMSGFQSPKKEIQTTAIGTDAEPVKAYVDSCIKQVGKEAIIYIGEHGGYFEAPEYFFTEGYAWVPYYFYNDKNLFPTKKTIEKELSKYIDEELFFCIANYPGISEQGVDIFPGITKTETTIMENRVYFKVKMPLEIRKGTTTAHLEDFSATVDKIRLNTIYEVSRAIIEEQMNDFTSICLQCITVLSIENDLYVSMANQGNGTIIFTIADNISDIGTGEYEFMFANKYVDVSCSNIPSDWPEERQQEYMLECMEKRMEEDYIFRLEDIPDLTVNVSHKFSYQAKAIGFNVSFDDYTDLFDIDKKTGQMDFTPTENQVGNHTIWISAKDGLENQAHASFRLGVVK